MTNHSPLVSLFKEQLENESKLLKAQHGLEKRGDLLTWWYFLRIEDLDETEISEITCDGGNDLGIDAVWIDEENIVHFYQFKNPLNATSAFPDGDVDKVLSGLRLILSRRISEIANDDLRALVEDIYQSVRNGYRLHLVTSGAGIVPESRVKLDAFTADLQSPSQDFFLWEDTHIGVLQDRFYRKTLPTVEAPIMWELRQQPYPVRSADHDSYILHLPGLVLANLYQEHGEQLLQQNIRVYAGDRATNNSILSTCTTDESGNFLHFNNGVTFLADSASWDAFAHTLTLEHGQVVNGGQTVRVLHSAFKDDTLRDDVTVVVRVITSSGHKGFANAVAVNLNNQNRITPSFLRSNDPRVMQLANSLASMGWYLERRQNEVRGFSDEERRDAETKIGRSIDDHVIRLKEGTQAYVATFMRFPELAKKNPRLMFEGTSDGGYFDRIFSRDLTAEKFVHANTISSASAAFVREFMKRKRRKERVESWEADYVDLVGPEIVEKHGAALDQVIPQSAVFLNAVLFEEAVRLREQEVEQLISCVQNDATSAFVAIIDSTMGFASGDTRWSGSWPTLLKSQSFFENYCSFRKGKIGGSVESKT